jgi:hypothetical protein
MDRRREMARPMACLGRGPRCDESYAVKASSNNDYRTLHRKQPSTTGNCTKRVSRPCSIPGNGNKSHPVGSVIQGGHYPSVEAGFGRFTWLGGCSTAVTVHRRLSARTRRPAVAGRTMRRKGTGIAPGAYPVVFGTWMHAGCTATVVAASHSNDRRRFS